MCTCIWLIIPHGKQVFSDYWFTLAALFYSLSNLAQVFKKKRRIDMMMPLIHPLDTCAIVCGAPPKPPLCVPPSTNTPTHTYNNAQVFFLYRNSRMFEHPDHFRKQLVMCVRTSRSLSLHL